MRQGAKECGSLRGKSARFSAGLILRLYVALALAYSLLLPLGEAPDEPGHYNYARIVAVEQRGPRGEEEHEAFQPPLYYWLAAPLAGLGDPTLLPLKANADFTLDPGGPANLLLHTRDEAFPYDGWALGWHLVRLLSLLCGALTVWGVHHLARFWAPGRRHVSVAATALFVLPPQFTLLHGAASNDTLALAIGTFLLLEAALIAAGHLSYKRLALVGLLWGLAILAKASMLAAGPGVAAAVLFGRLSRDGHRRWLLAWRDLALVGAVAAGVSGWWFARNVALYGDPLGWRLIFVINEARTEEVNWLRQIWGLWRSYWLSYIGMSLPRWLYLVLLMPLGLALLGVARSTQAWRSKARPRPLAVVVAVQGLAFLLSWGRWTLAVAGTDQARLLYPGLVAVAPALAVGILTWAVSRSRGKSGCRFSSEREAAWLVVALMVGLNLYALTSRVLPVFAPPERMRLADVPGIGERVDFGGRAELLAYDLPLSVTAGETLLVRTWWSALGTIEDDIWLTLRMVSGDGKVPVWKRGSPSAGRDSTDRWPAGVAVLGEHKLRLPPDLLPGTYTLEAGLQVFGQESWLLAAAGSEEPRELWPLGSVVVTAPQG